MQLTAKAKYSYGIGAFGKDMVYAVVSLRDCWYLLNDLFY